MTLPKGQKHQMATTVWPGPVQIIPWQLQREYGNRYVQRALALSRQGKEETESSSAARAHGESKKALRQLTHLKEVLQTRDKPARGFHGLVSQTSPLQVSRQGLLTAAEEAAAINFSKRYDERSVGIIQIITETNVDGNFGRLTAQAGRAPSRHSLF